MYWWVELIIYIVLAWYSYENRPSPPNAAPPSSLGEIDVPTAEAGKPIPVVFGTRQIKAPNCVWYGDMKTEPITTEVDTK